MYICIIISLLWEYWNRLNKSTDVFRRLRFTDFYFIYDKQIDLICQKSEILTNCSQILDIPSQNIPSPDMLSSGVKLVLWLRY